MDTHSNFLGDSCKPLLAQFSLLDIEQLWILFNSM